MKRIFSPRGFLVLFFIALILGLSWGFQQQDALERTLLWIDQTEAVQWLLLWLLYILTAVFFIPAFIVSLTAGYMLGVFPGVIVISLGSTFGAIVAFWVARTVARRLVEDKLIGHPKFQILDRAVGGQGFKVVFLSRIAPFLSYNLLNYMYGISCVSIRDYILGTWLGMIPASIVLAFLGASAKSVPDILEDPTLGITDHAGWILAGLSVTVTILYFLTKHLRRVFARMEQHLPPDEELLGVDFTTD